MDLPAFPESNVGVYEALAQSGIPIRGVSRANKVPDFEKGAQRIRRNPRMDSVELAGKY